MKALVYHGPGQRSWDTVEDPTTACGRLDPSLFTSHRFALDDAMAAYDTFADAANTNALKVVLERTNVGARDSRFTTAAAVA